MPLFIMPLKKRFTSLANPVGAGRESKYVCIDGWGILVNYNKEEDLTPENIRRHLIGLGNTKCYIDADNPEEALKFFHENYEGAKIGGVEDDRKALYIDKERKIIELPHCSRLNRNKKNEFICGKSRRDGQGEYGMCVLENYDPPSDCPINKFFRGKN